MAGLATDRMLPPGLSSVIPERSSVIVNAIDQNGDGVVDIYALNEFFRDQLSLLLEAEAPEIVINIEPLFQRDAKLTVEKCDEPTTFSL